MSTQTSQSILYSSWGNDECYTPKYAVLPLLNYIPKKYVIWCPFDTEESEFVKVFKEHWYTVISSHIKDWKDFFTYTPDTQWDIIISNPPFTNKRKFFERALQLGTPFALLMTNTWLNDSAPKVIFKEAGKDLQLLMFDKRIEFKQADGKVSNKVTFSSSYYCCDILPKGICIEYLNPKA